MSYRTIKRLLGETSLERKCRLLFGTGLLLLIAGSFALYGWLTVRLVYDQNRNTSRALVEPVVRLWHADRVGAGLGATITRKEATDTRAARPLVTPTSPSDVPEHEEYTWQLYSLEPDAPSDLRPVDVDLAAYERIRSEPEAFEITSGDERDVYNYYVPLRATDNCLSGCHAGNETNQLLGMARISIPLTDTKRALAQNNAFLITTAIVTAVLAMAAAWAIVRYVIVKPVLHLKDVSDEIARGTLDLRADIRTGDEFEELSHAFNRMLRHLITMQDELKEVNTEVEGKVDELARVNLRLYETNKLKDEFLATMSHELRTPLNSILGFSDVLAGADNLTDKQKRFVANVQKSGRDLLLLINDVLDLAKIESGKLELQPADIRLTEIVDKQVDAMIPMAERKNIDLTSSVDLDMPVLRQDPGKLQQILNNLLSNALKFTPEGGRVRVRGTLCDDGRDFELIVEDTGIGIPLEDQATIFEKFRQGRSVPGQRDAMTREFGGTGLGLSIVKELARLLGGEVFLESEFGKGSTFIVRLPISLDERDRHDEPRKPAVRPRSEPVIARVSSRCE
ncbi:MAG: HAMP domain-containing protein [Planctomycetaceae bacterium]|nr:HAMP domain-containing protein [Planctomycetaceae bacterium]